MSASPGRFSWWDTRDKAWRRARLLFVLAAVVVAIYAAGILVVVGATLSAAGIGPWHRLDTWSNNLGSVGIVLASLVLLAIASRARPSQRDEEHEVDAAVASFALAYGMPAPQVWIIDDPAPNGLGSVVQLLGTCA